MSLACLFLAVRLGLASVLRLAGHAISPQVHCRAVSCGATSHPAGHTGIFPTQALLNVPYRPISSFLPSPPSSLPLDSGGHASICGLHEPWHHEPAALLGCSIRHPRRITGLFVCQSNCLLSISHVNCLHIGLRFLLDNPASLSPSFPPPSLLTFHFAARSSRSSSTVPCARQRARVPGAPR